METIYFKLEKVADSTGTPVDTLVKYTQRHEYGPTDPFKEPWCTVQELDKLFEACSQRWGSNWDLNKVITAIGECEFD